MNNTSFFTISNRREDILDAIEHKEILDVTPVFLKKDYTPVFNRPKSPKGFAGVMAFYNSLLYKVLKLFLDMGMCKSVILGSGNPLDENSIESFYNNLSAKIVFETNKGSKLQITVKDLKYGAYIAICSHYNVFFETNNYLNFITVDKYFSADCILSAFDSYSIRTKSKDIAFLKEVDWDRIDEYILYGIN